MMPGTVFVGFAALAINDCTHCMLASSRHIGSRPGVSGSSAMHVQPFVPGRIVAILPLASGAITAAWSAISRGAADVALRTISTLDIFLTFAFAMDAVIAPCWF